MTICTPYIAAGNSEQPERYGPIRNMRGPQDEINHRRSKAIHLLHTREIHYETGALAHPEEAEAELLKANPMLEYGRGRLKDGVEIVRNTDLAMAQVQMLQEAKSEIDQIGPRPMPTEGSGGSKMSGRLYIAQQETGAMEMRPVFDALRRWAISIFKRYAWLIRQTWTEEQWFNVKDEESDEGYRLVSVNRKMTRGERFQEALDNGIELERAARFAYGKEARLMVRGAKRQVQQMVAQMTQQAIQEAQAQGSPPTPPPQPKPADIQAEVVGILLQDKFSADEVVANDVGRVNVDLIIETSPNSVLAQHEQFQELVGMAKDGLLPLQDPKILKVIIEASSLRNKRKLAAMLDQPPDEATVQAQQAQQQAQQAQMQKQIELLGAQVQKMLADAEAAKAKAALAASKVQTEPTVGMLNQAKAQKALSDAEADSTLKRTQAVKTAQEAGEASVPQGEQ
jgi:hypothetical protein